MDTARLLSNFVTPLASEGRWRHFESYNPVAFFIQSRNRATRLLHCPLDWSIAHSIGPLH
ncbi:hypothetical protein BQ8794_70013 [Mesorhizobium prunaredense]|uniref:Uncharacterized protein n=1 Tax=Mesorhizobium prunaredense TaxID=1631249 RepID=A0A1R3VGQ8_9HYPH|nr:hypothetical protein BQ8794_70013 [Mesorhizobium prunaredense]